VQKIDPNRPFLAKNHVNVSVNGLKRPDTVIIYLRHFEWRPHMKTPFIIAMAIVLGIIATNILIPKGTRDFADMPMVEDKIDTSQAAPTQVGGDVPL
jgi:hypothetical protein